MKEVLEKIKIPLIVLAVLIVGFIGYNVFVKKDTTSTSSATTTTSVASQKTEIQQRVDKEIVPLLNKVSDINFDESLFKDPVFVYLHDFGLEIIPESKGRKNPFAPSTAFSSASGSQGVSFGEDKSTSTPKQK